MNVVPSPSAVQNVNEPPLRSTSERAIASPCPVPRPTALVVKNVSNILPRIASGIPGPVSSMSTSTKSSPPRERTTMEPRVPSPASAQSAMAWAALTSRFSTTWCSSPRRHSTRGPAGSSSVTTSATYFQAW